MAPCVFLAERAELGAIGGRAIGRDGTGLMLESNVVISHDSKPRSNGVNGQQ